RSKVFLLVLPVVWALVAVGPYIWWLSVETSRHILLPVPPTLSLEHYRWNRSLHHYLDNIQTLIEPSLLPCTNPDEIVVLVLVASAPLRFEHRQAVRMTWGAHLPTYFVLGLQGDNVDEQLVDNYIEGKQYSDLILFEFHDHYQNLTLKTALMMKWTLQRCPQAQFLFKTDDDVMVNPWTLRKVLKKNEDAPLLGYNKRNTYLHRDEYRKWYTPRWMLREDRVSQYLSGTGYLISGDFISKILKNAYKVPMVNLEDVYFTYLVAHRRLGLRLVHERRLSPYKPWLKASCLYWDLASVHSMAPDEMITAWAKIEYYGNMDHHSDICWFFNKYLRGYSELALY
ncbi:hypothetical protein HW555_009934, partial [Spodoptera exigua]